MATRSLRRPALRPREAAGTLFGWALAPLTGLIAAVRRARTFHPEGVCYRARVEPWHGPGLDAGPLAQLAARLAGPALCRLSTAWWRRGKQWPDVLGVALRLRSTSDVDTEPRPGDQDLLFATVRWPWTTPLGPLTTRVGDFLANDYHAVSPFLVEGLTQLGPVKWRLRPLHDSEPGGDRMTRLARTVARGEAVFALEARLPSAADTRGGALRHRRAARRWRPVARVTLLEEVPLDQERLRFSPFRAGRGIVPVGFVHALRRGPYAASQELRPREA